MLGFVNGRSCAHKSKPRGLILCFIILSAKVVQFFYKKGWSLSFYFVNFCYRAYKKNAPDFFRNQVQK